MDQKLDSSIFGSGGGTSSATGGKVTWWISLAFIIAIYLCFGNNSPRTTAFSPDHSVVVSDYSFPNRVVLSSDGRDHHPSPPFPSSSHIGKRITKKNRRENESVEEGLARARSTIRRAVSSTDHASANSGNGSAAEITVYRNPAAFYQSYREMERRFKVYVYEEGDQPLFHDGPCKNIYTSEGRFIHEIEHGDRRFRTTDPLKAQAFFLPFSITWMVKYLYKANSKDMAPLKQTVSDYVNLISTKHPFWNRTQGADHFMLACHDWGPHVSKSNELLYKKSIRVLCNANTSEGFNPIKDVTLPEINLLDGNISPKLLSPPSSTAAPRPYLAFFAGGVHGPIRPILLRHWQGRDLPEIQVYEYLPQHLDYYSFMMKSKFCLCPSGYEVASPRIAEAIYADCVPVVISENYVLPFSDVLRWEAFSISVEVKDIPRLKEILMGVPEDDYRKLQKGVRAVRKHFVLNRPTKKFDVFHMILHSIWLRRINVKVV